MQLKLSFKDLETGELFQLVCQEHG